MGHATAYGCTFEGCNRSFSVESNLRRHARTHLQSVNEDRESEGEEESEEGSPRPQEVPKTQIPQPRKMSPTDPVGDHSGIGLLDFHTRRDIP
jgi:hypothetical protein